MTSILRWTLSAVRRFATWSVAIILWWAVIAILWVLIVVIWAVSTIVWSLWRALHLVARAIMVDILWLISQVKVNMYVAFVEMLCGVVVRLLVANGMSVAVGYGCYGASEDVG